MALYYQIKQGDHLSKIAAHYGFLDYHTIWDHPKNAAYKAKRQNPNVLYPGDCLYIPDKQEKQESRVTDQRHVFRIAPKLVRLQIIVEDVDHQPLMGKRYSLLLGTQAKTGATDGVGQLKEQISVEAEEANLRIQDLSVPVRIGHLDPVDTPSGQIARLTNLGYYLGRLDNLNPIDAGNLRSAVEEFQCDNSLVVDGRCGPATQAKLKQVHGC